MTRVIPALAACLLVACTRAAQPSGPVPLEVTPDRSAAVVPVPLEIVGRDFDARVQTGFDGSEGDELDARFTARLEPAAGAAVALEDVTYTERRTLRAVAPAGIPRGLYRLVVTDPRGRSGALEQAFRVVAGAERVAGFRVEVLESPRAGVPFGVSLTAIDALGDVVDGFAAAVTLTDLTGSVTPTSVGPFALGRFQGQVVIALRAASDQLIVSDGSGHSGSSPSFDVVAGPPMAVVFPGTPVTAAAGACSPPVEVELRDALGNPAPAEAELISQLQSAPPGVAFFSDAACTDATVVLTVGGGGTRAAFHFRSAAAGPVTIRVLPASLPGATQTETVSP